MKKILLAAATLMMLVSCGNRANKKTEQATAQEPAPVVEVDTTTEATPAVISEEPVFDIVTTMGTIRVKLYANTPKHRDNFVKLAQQGFYEGTLFHRVIPGFMIQGGDPLTKDEANAGAFGTGDPGYTIPNEIASGNHHALGALAAARKGDVANPKRESSGSQFYIVQDEAGCGHLDGAYTVFGQTIEGFEVIDAIARVPRNERDCPLTPVKIIKVKLAE